MIFNKIIVIGSPGSGKSHFSRELAKKSSIPLTHLDVEFWKPGWVPTPKEEWIKRQLEIMSTPTWIIDGNYNSTMELRIEHCDAIIFLDIHPIICIIGAITRHGNKRSDLPDYLEETFNKDFLDFLKFIWLFPKKNRVKILSLHDKYPNKQLYIFKSRCKANKFIQSFPSQT